MGASKVNIKKNDQVVVIAGREKGKKGRVVARASGAVETSKVEAQP